MRSHVMERPSAKTFGACDQIFESNPQIEDKSVET
jgi:hypothetical protein